MWYFFFLFCLPCYISGVRWCDTSSSSSAFPVISLESDDVILLLPLLPSLLYLWGQMMWYFFFLFCLPCYISGVRWCDTSSSSSAFPALSLGSDDVILLLPLPPSLLYLWSQMMWYFFFLFCLPCSISGVRWCGTSSSSSAFPVISLESDDVILLLPLLPSLLYLWGQMMWYFFFFFCLLCSISGVRCDTSSSSAFPALSLGSDDVILLPLLPSLLCLWGQMMWYFFFLFCLPCSISGVRWCDTSSSSSAFPALSLGSDDVILLLPLLPSLLYLWGQMMWYFFFLFCLLCYISGVRCDTSSSSFPALSLGSDDVILLLLLLCSVSGVRCDTSSAFPALSLGSDDVILLLLLLCYISGVRCETSSSASLLYLWGQMMWYFLFCLPCSISGVRWCGTSSSSSAFSAISLGSNDVILLLLLLSLLYLWGSLFWVRFLCVHVFFFNFFIPTIEVVTFFVHGAYWVCVCCQHSPVYDMNVRIFWSVQWNACAHRLDLSYYPKDFWGEWSQKPCKEENLLYWRLTGGSNLQPCITQDSQLNTLPTELFRTQMMWYKDGCVWVMQKAAKRFKSQLFTWTHCLLLLLFHPVYRDRNNV